MRKRARGVFAAQLDAKAGKGRFYARRDVNAWLNDSHSLFNGSFGKGKAKDKFGY